MRNLNSFWLCLLTLALLLSCSSDDDNEQTLASYVRNKTIEQGGVIACAASDKDTGAILTFYYPEEGASNIRYYQTLNLEVDSNNYSNYTQEIYPISPVFNGYLGKFTHSATHEKWMIVTFELNGEIKISNPIRSKHISKPTVWNDQVAINQSQSIMPVFNWEDNPEGDNAIYFQVITDDSNNLLSGTYTYENNFQFYNTSNVVLNVTRNNPPNLEVGNSYNFTLMDVSEDNWVNWVVEKTFQAQ